MHFNGELHSLLSEHPTARTPSRFSSDDEHDQTAPTPKSCTIASNARTSIRLIHIDDCGQARLSSEAAAGSKMRAILTSGRQLIRGDAAAAHAADRDGRARRAIGGDG